VPPAVDEFDLSDVKKKKKSSKKKALLDLEAFEKEIGDEKPKEVEEGAENQEEEGDLEYDPFAADDAAPVTVGINTGKEPWIGSDRDYKYTEVSRYDFVKLHSGLMSSSCYRDSLLLCMLQILLLPRV
jgi:translation initiation factor 2 subunit 2